jgi:hypothetical protein
MLFGLAGNTLDAAGPSQQLPAIACGAVREVASRPAGSNPPAMKNLPGNPPPNQQTIRQYEQ